MYDYVWLCMRGRERGSKSNFTNFFILLQFFKQFKLFYMIKMFLKFSYKPWHCLPLFTSVYLCSTDASMHQFCACFLFLLFSPIFGGSVFETQSTRGISLNSNLLFWYNKSQIEKSVHIFIKYCLIIEQIC